jgi:hypothetical protein
MAPVLACLYYRLLQHGKAWVDRSTEEFENKRQQRETAALQRKALSLGMQIVAAI